MSETSTESTEVIAPDPAAQEIAFGAVPWRLDHVVFGFAPLVAVMVVALSPVVQMIPPPVRLMAGASIQIWALGYPLALAWRYGWRPRFSFSPRRVAIEFLIAVLTLCAVWAVVAAGYVAWSALFGAPPAPSGSALERVGRASNLATLIVLAALAIVAAPVAEEVFFRGMVYRAFRRRATPRVAALAIQAVAFGLLHASSGPTHVVVTAAGGVAFALVSDLRKTLVTPILCHGLHNAVVFAIFLSAGGWNPNPPVVGVHGTPHESGMLVTQVMPNSGADSAGIRQGDVLHSVNGWGVQTAQHVFDAIHDNRVGETVPVEYIRDGELYRVDVVLRSLRDLTP